MVLASSDGTPTRYYAHAGGRPALLVLADQACAARLQALAAGLGAIGDADLTVHVVGPPALAGHDLPFPLLQDPDGRAAAAYRTGGAPTAFLLDPNLRVRATLPFADGARTAAEVAELVAELVWDDRRPREVTTQAPLLVVPDVLGPEQCAELIAVWEQEGHSETGVESSTGGGRAEQRSAQLKRRRDHVVQDPRRSRELAARIGRRVMPSWPRRSRTAPAASRASRSPATRRPTAGSSAPTATTSAPRPPTVGSRSPSTSTMATRAVSYASPSTDPSCTGRLLARGWCSAARTCTRSSR
jgi:hypothetical protein